MVLDVANGELLATEHPEEAANLATAPGSTLKPFFLAAALAQHRIEPGTTLLCHPHLRIGNRNLDCTHPPQYRTFDAEHALAYSCNSYFAALATRWTGQEAASILHQYGFQARTGLLPAESPGSLHVPETPEELQLLVLGLEGITVTPLQMAAAYRQFALRQNPPRSVTRGLEGSVEYGMAHNAITPGLFVSGKTGTAGDPGQAWTHGWFAGIVAPQAGKIVIVIYLPRGNGGDAARLAHGFLSAWAQEAAQAPPAKSSVAYSSSFSGASR